MLEPSLKLIVLVRAECTLSVSWVKIQSNLLSVNKKRYHSDQIDIVIQNQVLTNKAKVSHENIWQSKWVTPMWFFALARQENRHFVSNGLTLAYIEILNILFFKNFGILKKFWHQRVGNKILV